MTLDELLKRISEADTALDLSNVQLAHHLKLPKSYDAFCAALVAKKSKLKELNLSNSGLASLTFLGRHGYDDQFAIEQIFVALGQLKQLTSLNLGRNHIFGLFTDRSIDWEKLFRHIGSITTLEHLDISYNNFHNAYPDNTLVFRDNPHDKLVIPSRGVPLNHFLYSLTSLTNLKSLNISDSGHRAYQQRMFSTPQKFCTPLTFFLSKLTKLERLILRDLNLHCSFAQDVTPLLDKIESLPHLLELDLGNEEVVFPVEYTQIVLYWNHILKIIDKNPKLLLNISRNGFAGFYDHSDDDCYALITLSLQSKMGGSRIKFDQKECYLAAHHLASSELWIRDFLNDLMQKPADKWLSHLTAALPLAHRQTGKHIFKDRVPTYKTGSSCHEYISALIDFGFDVFSTIARVNLQCAVNPSKYEFDDNGLYNALSVWKKITEAYKLVGNIENKLNNLLQLLLDLVNCPQTRRVAVEFIKQLPPEEVETRFLIIERVVMTRIHGKSVSDVLLPVISMCFKQDGEPISFEQLPRGQLVVFDTMITNAHASDKIKVGSVNTLANGERVRMLKALRSIQAYEKPPQADSAEKSPQAGPA